MKKRTVAKSCFIAGLTALVLLLAASCAFAETNGYPVKITINEPVEKVEAGLHMNIRGDFSSEIKIPDDAILRIELMDADGNVVRSVSQSEKNSKKMWLYYPGLIYYDEETDPGRKELEAFGWPEIMVRDVSHPEESFLDATLKCWYSDTEFKSMFIYATDKEHGLTFDDTIGFTDENGEAYEALPVGSYTVSVTLKDRDGAILGECEKAFEIGYSSDKIAVRFQPIDHRLYIMDWARSLGYKDLGSAIPGYIEAMNDHGHPYDMGIIPFNRASNLAFYTTGKIHWFDYNITSTCSSYVIEHAVVQDMHDIENPDRFVVYYYDLGELSIKNDLGVDEQGRIATFQPGDLFNICRVDIVNGNAEENDYYLDAGNVLSVKRVAGQTGEDPILIDGERFAVMGVIAPFQLEEADIHFDPSDNSYSFSNRIETIIYHFTDEQGKTDSVEKRVELSRHWEDRLQTSIFEFYSIFDAGDFQKDTVYTVSISGVDSHGVVYESDESFAFTVKP